MIINTYNAVSDLLQQILPTTIHNTLNLAYTAITHTLTPSILTSLLYRIFVLYAATRIIPAVRGVSQGLTSEPNFDSHEPVPSHIPTEAFEIVESLPSFSDHHYHPSPDPESSPNPPSSTPLILFFLCILISSLPN